MDGAAAPSGQYPDLDIYPELSDSSQTVEQHQEDEICWICMEPPAPGEDLKQWVRPCKCTLTAHQSCLREWVNSQQPMGRGPVACPQCKTVYHSELPKGWMIRIATVLEEVDELISLPVAALSAIAVPTALGYSSLRAYLGSSATRLLLTGTTGLAATEKHGMILRTAFVSRSGHGADSPMYWHRGALFALPLVPLVGWMFEHQSQSRKKQRLLGAGQLPYLIIPWLPIAILAQTSTSARARLLRIDGSFPPGPVTTLAALQVLNLAYPMLRYRINNLIFNTPDHTPTEPNESTVRRIWNALGRPLVNALTDPLCGWLAGMGLRAIGRRWPPLGDLLGMSYDRRSLRRSQQTWRVDGVQPDWWSCALGGCLYAVVRDVCRFSSRSIRLSQMRNRRIMNRSEIPPEDREAMTEAAAPQARVAGAPDQPEQPPNDRVQRQEQRRRGIIGALLALGLEA